MFAPRYAKLGSRSKMIYGFKNPKQYGDYFLKPIRKINTKLIKEEWENILKIFVSLGFKSSTQSTIIRKLSSYARKNRTKKALWELDNIVKTLYILKYVDSIELRRNVQRALNRGEAYNKLRKTVFYAFFGKFRVKTELEQQIWSECTRLITNAIIFYNAYLLSELLKKKEANGMAETDFIKAISPVAWRHINLYGVYEFHRKASLINISEIINNLDEKSMGIHLTEGSRYLN